MTQFIDPRQWERERALFRYALALEQDDDEMVLNVLAQAETDAVLERMIFDWHATLLADDEGDASRFAHDAVTVQQLADEHLATGTEAELAPPAPLAIKDVIARLRDDPHLRARLTNEMTQLADQLAENTTPLPEDLSLGAVQQLLAAQAVPLSRPFLKMFRDAAINLAMGHEQALNVAARRQQGQKSSTNGKKEPQS